MRSRPPALSCPLPPRIAKLRTALYRALAASRSPAVAAGVQSRAEVVPLRQGDGVIFAANARPLHGSKGRVKMRHGVSRLTRGHRHTLGVICGLEGSVPLVIMPLGMTNCRGR